MAQNTATLVVYFNPATMRLDVEAELAKKGTIYRHLEDTFIVRPYKGRAYDMEGKTVLQIMKINIVSPLETAMEE